jgi:hypothetical protein
MRKLCTTIIGLLVWLAFAADAHAKLVEYVSQHPVPHKFGGGFCTIDVPHVHNYAPADPRMYRELGGQLYFVGDPTPFHYEGPRFAYYGAHPVVDAEVRFDHPIYCYMKGPHYHWYQPPPHAHFQLTGGAYWYVGSFPPVYYQQRPRFAVVNEAYVSLPYVRPVVDVHVAPPALQAEISIGGPGWSASAVVGAPAVPGFVPPPPPIPVPVPVGVAVGVNLGGPAVVQPGEIVREPRRHDQGRHVGWREPERFHGRRPPPSRFIVGHAPVERPIFRRGTAQHPVPRVVPQHPAPQRPAPQRAAGMPTRGPAPAPATRAAMPTRGPAPARNNRRR